jgi:hypothetical protein
MSWQDLAVPDVPDAPAATAPAEGAPSWQSLAVAAPDEPKASEPDLSTQEKAYRVSANQGWIGKLYSALGGFHDQMGRALTMGLSDKIAAIEPAAIHAAAKGINHLYSGSGGVPPFPEAENENFADIYHENLAKERAASERYAQENPYASGAAKTLGVLGSIPMMAEAAPGKALASGASLGTKALQGAKVGAAVGGLAGFGGANDTSIADDAKQVALGSGAGAALGAGGAVVADKVLAPVVDWVTSKFGPDAVENQGVKQVMKRISASAHGGGPTAQDMLDIVAANPGKPLMLADVGGVPVQGLGERIATSPGAGSQIAADALNARDAAAGTRVAEDLSTNLADGDSNFSTVKALSDARAAAARPAYEKAGIPSDPSLYPQAPVVDSPKVTALLQKSKDVRAAITQAKSLPDYADLPDNSIVLLDKAYKNIGGAANQAKVSGNGELARDMNSLRGNLLDAITEGKADHPYKLALDAYSGPSGSLDAVKDGAAFMAKSPDQIASEIADLHPGDQEFYRLGAANALKTQILKTSQGGNEALKIAGNDYVKSQIRALAPSDAAAQKLIDSAGLESKMFETKTNTLGNSRTARRVAEAAANSPEGGFMGALAQTAAGAMTGEPVVSGMGAMNLAKRIFSAGTTPSPKVDAATARLLFNPSAGANQTALARIMALQSAPTRVQFAGALPAALAGANAGRVTPLLPPYQ